MSISTLLITIIILLVFDVTLHIATCSISHSHFKTNNDDQTVAYNKKEHKVETLTDKICLKSNISDGQFLLSRLKETSFKEKTTYTKMLKLYLKKCFETKRIRSLHYKSWHTWKNLKTITNKI